MALWRRFFYKGSVNADIFQPVANSVDDSILARYQPPWLQIPRPRPKGPSFSEELLVPVPNPPDPSEVDVPVFARYQSPWLQIPRPRPKAPCVSEELIVELPNPPDPTDLIPYLMVTRWVPAYFRARPTFPKAFSVSSDLTKRVLACNEWEPEVLETSAWTGETLTPVCG